MKITVSTKGRYEPNCFDNEGQEDSSRPYVEYTLLTGEEVEAITAVKDDKAAWARIWREKVTAFEGVTFEIDGKEKKVDVKDVPSIPGTYLLYYEVANHILQESILGQEAKKKLP